MSKEFKGIMRKNIILKESLAILNDKNPACTPEKNKIEMDLHCIAKAILDNDLRFKPKETRSIKKAVFSHNDEGILTIRKYKNKLFREYYFMSEYTDINLAEGVLPIDFIKMVIEIRKMYEDMEEYIEKLFVDKSGVKSIPDIPVYSKIYRTSHNKIRRISCDFISVKRYFNTYGFNLQHQVVCKININGAEDRENLSDMVLPDGKALDEAINMIEKIKVEKQEFAKSNMDRFNNTIRKMYEKHGYDKFLFLRDL